MSLLSRTKEDYVLAWVFALGCNQGRRSSIRVLILRPIRIKIFYFSCNWDQSGSRSSTLLVTETQSGSSSSSQVSYVTVQPWLCTTVYMYFILILGCWVCRLLENKLVFWNIYQSNMYYRASWVPMAIALQTNWTETPLLHDHRIRMYVATRKTTCIFMY